MHIASFSGPLNNIAFTYILILIWQFPFRNHNYRTFILFSPVEMNVCIHAFIFLGGPMIVQSLHLPPLIMFLIYILQYSNIATLMFLTYIAVFGDCYHSVSNIYCSIRIFPLWCFLYMLPYSDIATLMFLTYIAILGLLWDLLPLVALNFTAVSN